MSLSVQVMVRTCLLPGGCCWSGCHRLRIWARTWRILPPVSFLFAFAFARFTPTASSQRLQRAPSSGPFSSTCLPSSLRVLSHEACESAFLVLVAVLLAAVLFLWFVLVPFAFSMRLLLLQFSGRVSASVGVAAYTFWHQARKADQSGGRSPGFGDMWRCIGPKSPDWDSDVESWDRKRRHFF